MTLDCIAGIAAGASRQEALAFGWLLAPAAQGKLRLGTGRAGCPDQRRNAIHPRDGAGSAGSRCHRLLHAGPVFADAAVPFGVARDDRAADPVRCFVRHDIRPPKTLSVLTRSVDRTPPSGGRSSQWSVRTAPPASHIRYGLTQALDEPKANPKLIQKKKMTALRGR